MMATGAALQARVSSRPKSPAAQQIAGEEHTVQPRPMRIVLAIVGLCALALFILGMVQVASGVALSPALTVALVLLGGLLSICG